MRRTPQDIGLWSSQLPLAEVVVADSVDPTQYWSTNREGTACHTKVVRHLVAN